MKNYNKILEAVNRGIKFALDDFEDQEDIQSLVNSKVNHYKGSWGEYLDSFVNLGLPSKTLWCKYNLGANTETEYGDYYAWGELTTKDKFTEKNYTYKDKPKQLPPEHDVATQKLGSNFHIPTAKLFNELLKYTKNTLIHDYKNTGVNGYLFTGKNGNSIFIPAAGYKNGLTIEQNNIGCFVLSSNLDDKFNDSIKGFYCISKYCGLNLLNCFTGSSIRPVLKL